jgi:hypothetical protein
MVGGDRDQQRLGEQVDAVDVPGGTVRCQAILAGQDQVEITARQGGQAVFRLALFDAQIHSRCGGVQHG